MEKNKSKLQKYIFRIQVVIIVTMAVLLGATGILLNLMEDSRQRDTNLRNVAESIAKSNIIASASLGEEDLTEYLDTLKESLVDIDVISVVGEDNIRLYHSNHELIGTVYDGALPDFSEFQKSYTVTDEGPSGVQRRAYASITNSDGKSTGFVMAIMLMSSIRAKTVRTLTIFILITLLAIVAELIISYNISAKIRSRLMGYDPEDFSSMFMVRDNTLESLNEGIIAVDSLGKLQYINQAAKKMLGLDTGATSGSATGGTSRQDVEGGEKERLPERLMSTTLATGERETAVSSNLLEGKNILIDRRPIVDDEGIKGAIGILHNREEYTKMAEDLAGTRFLVDSMRANNHDFTNKLHVIMGLLQMEMYDKAISYIENISMVQRETISSVMQASDSPAVAALLIGKTARAAELNIKFRLTEGSRYRKEEVWIPDDTMVTILGNLIENALEAIDGDGNPKEENSVFVTLKSGEESLLMTVKDSGPGIPEEHKNAIFDNGFSTKGEGRGTGLNQVKQLVTSYGGEIKAERNELGGTTFTVTFDRR